MTQLFTEEDQSILFEGVELNEDVKTQFFDKLETVIIEKVNSKEEELIEKHETLHEQFKEELIEEMEGNINKYLDYVVEEWMSENEMALETGIKVELMENFMTGIKDLFQESYVEIPEDKIDIVSEAEEKITTLEVDLANSIDTIVALKESVEELQKEKVISEQAIGLTETEKEKFETLLEGVDFGSPEVFARKAKTIRESYFDKSTKKEVIKESVDHNKSNDDNNDPMSKYLNHL
jgi:hypothetical protein